MNVKDNTLLIAVVTGAAGFAGYSLTKQLVDDGYRVYAVVRPGSKHNKRLEGLDLNIIELDASEYDKLPKMINCKCDYFFHLAWSGGRDSFDEQVINIAQAISALEASVSLGCNRFIATGSQAEYGVCDSIIDERLLPKPVNAYGAAKVSAMYLTKRRAEQLGIEWIWARIFSLYGKYEPSGRMLPDVVDKLINKAEVKLSSCAQYWDYLDVEDAAKALIALAEKGQNGEVYNVANGDCRPLKEYVKEIVSVVAKDAIVEFGNPPTPFISLKPDVSKIVEHTGWKPTIDFKEGIRKVLEERKGNESGRS